MIQVYKILHGIDKVDKDKLFTMSTFQTTRGNSLKLFKKRASTEIRRNVFGYRVVDGWNGLPDNIVTAPSVNSFKNRLNKQWVGHPFKFITTFY